MNSVKNMRSTKRAKGDAGAKGAKSTKDTKSAKGDALFESAPFSSFDGAGYGSVLLDILEHPQIFSEEEEAVIAQLEADLAKQLRHKPHRLEHSLGVGNIAQALTAVYGGDEELQYKARVAGILHDWEKAHDLDELLDKATQLHLEQDPLLKGITLINAKPLLHGFIAKKTLKERYPFLTDDVFRAIALHTLGSIDASFLDKVVYIADFIEPSRGDEERLRKVREIAGIVSLKELYFASYQASVLYVIQTGRYLLPASVVIYNGLLAH